jgi:hypothetical protein
MTGAMGPPSWVWATSTCLVAMMKLGCESRVGRFSPSTAAVAAMGETFMTFEREKCMKGE